MDPILKEPCHRETCRDSTCGARVAQTGTQPPGTLCSNTQPGRPCPAARLPDSTKEDPQMKSLSLSRSLPALLLLATASFAACGGSSTGDPQNRADSSSAGKTSTSGAGGVASSGGSASSGESARSCASSDCGPVSLLPSMVCADGSFGGPTGRCLRLDSGDCSWEIRTCPPQAVGGANAGGAAAAAGVGAAGVAGMGEAGAAGAAPISDRCGGCSSDAETERVCIYQAGGPGPGEFVCATRPPCRAAGACACIAGQGACNSMMSGGSPAYCVCDNGLE